MKKISRLFCLLASLVIVMGMTEPLTAQDDSTYTRRPKIAVVLAGGGAKGVAHVAALKAIEDAGIPIDLVVGTSIGSIVGGMYCTGYSPDTMRKIIAETDWIKMITENPDFDNRSLSSKKDDENYILRFAVDANRIKSSTGLGGVLQGTNVIHFFRKLTRFLPDSLDFTDMPTPFACIGTNAVTGERKVFTSGNVPLAMRASMAIPTAFTPVTIDSLVYVDGGVCDNFPVDVAREMGADIVIGVDLTVKKEDSQLTNSAIDLLMHCVDLFSQETYRRNVADADIYIPIDVTGYSAASFGREALDTLMQRGDHYASLKKPQLDSLRQTLNLAEEPIRIRVGDYAFAKSNELTSSWKPTEEESRRNSLYLANEGSLKSSVSIGGRYDNQEYATLQLRAGMVLSEKKAALLAINGRLGSRLEGKADLSLRTFGTQRVGLSYKFQRHDIAMNYRGDKIINLDLKLNKVNLYLTQEWHNIKYTFGANYNNYHLDDILYDAEFFDEKDKHKTQWYFSYYLKGEVNTLNQQYFPTRGQRIEISADLVTDNLIGYQNVTPLPIFAGSATTMIPVNNRLVFAPHVYARIMVTEDIEEPWVLKNIAGGMFNEQHFLQQNVMAGLSRMELFLEDGLVIAGINAQYSPYKNHYIVLNGDVCSHTNHILKALEKDAINWGVDVSYNIRTALGPLGLKFYWSDLSKNFSATLNAGYYF